MLSLDEKIGVLKIHLDEIDDPELRQHIQELITLEKEAERATQDVEDAERELTYWVEQHAKLQARQARLREELKRRRAPAEPAAV